ncbi:efflux RND transporter periplasmic adaptor subunit [Sphingomicrobium nitratireducens]|uniref:efflux RND transporter periplasmic adaptor subunit n=1 Tax=Sphingomicrobium nitratireducens TaxID=2964666 RepID=UPI00223FC374|nr:efflux RND transporter periplasmic adaptor subunit [Sphingomicrobium nitratireducens]
MNRETGFGVMDIETQNEIQRRKRRRVLIIGAAILVAVLAAAFFMMRGGAADEERTEAPATVVTVIVPGVSEIARTITASGTLAARRDQPVGVSGQGGRVTRVLVDAGDWVKQGQLLAQIERSVQSQEAAQLRASVAAAEADAALARNELDRAQALVERGFVSKADIDRKQAAYDAARARVRLNQAQLGAANARIGLLDVRAPTSGLVLDRSVEVGQVVSAGTPQLFRMARGGEMEVRAELSQQDMAAVSVGLPATVNPVGTDREFVGRVWQVAPIIDPTTRQGEVRIAIPYDSAIRPGGFAEARIESGTTSAPLLPQAAVMADARGNYVYVVNDKNEVVRVDVKVGSVDDRGVTIVEGLTGNEVVVRSAGPFLTPGQKVSPKRQAARKEG